MSNKKIKIDFKTSAVDFIVITIGAFIAAAAVFFFLLPSNVVIGSGSALAMVLNHFIPLPVWVLNLLINVILLLLGFILVGPEFGIKTVYTAIMVPAFIGLLENLCKNFESLTGNDPLLDVIGYIMVVGIGSAILFARNASSGGLDIVAKIMNKHLKMDLGKAMSISGITIALTSVFITDNAKIVVLSVIGTYFCGMMLDYFMVGFDLKRKVCIISSKFDVFVDFILHDLNSGATIYESYGAYDKTVHKEIVTIVDKSEYRKLMDFIRKTDPKAFITVYKVNSMQYQPKVKK
ncbi:MAG: YitT family protein [Clostridia bacterium]|nr:YitT family protein [Clostridia bacterium]